MAFNWDTIDTDVNPALDELPEFNSGAFNADSNPHGLANGGHISQFPLALGDIAIVANAFPAFADLMSGYADAASASATSASTSAATLAGTSTTSLSIQTGSKVFTTQSGKQFGQGQWLIATSDSGPTSFFMIGQVTAYSGTSLTINVLLTKGSGTKADWTIRQTGVPGRSAGLAYIWSTNTASSDPGSGKIKFNNSTMASVTAMYISQTDFDSNSLAALMTTWDDSTSTNKARVYIQNPTAPANFLIVDITSTLTDNSGWDTFTVAYVAAGGTLANDSVVSVLVVPSANKGDTGATGGTGPQGSQGNPGVDGSDGGFKYTFSTGTSGDPTTGKVRFDNGTFGSATKVALSETDADGNTLSAFLAAVDDSTSTNKAILVLKKQGGSAFFSGFITSTLTDQGTYDEFNFTPITSGGTILNGDTLRATFYVIGNTGSTGSTGNTGDSGPFSALTWTYSTTTTDSDPGSGTFRFDSGTIGSVTKAYFDNNEAGGSSVTAWLDALDDSTNTVKGQLTFVQKTDPTKLAIFNVSGSVVDGTGYRKVTLAYVAGPGGFANGAVVGVGWGPAGNKGSDGAGSGTYAPEGTPVTGRIAVFGSSAGEQLANSSGAPGALAFLNTVGSSQIDASAVTYAKIQNVGANKLLGSIAGGAPEEIALTSAGRALIDDADVTAQKTTLGLENVTNTSDANKPVSTATQTLLDLYKHPRVRAATTANITISTALNNGDSLDGLTLATGELVLVKDQTSPAENGVYVVGAVPARHGEFDAFADYPGVEISVQEGTANADSLWLCTSNTGGTIDSTSLTFVRQGGASTAAGRSMLNAADAAAQKTLLSIGVADITDATANGRSLISAANYAAMKTLLAVAVADITDATANGRSLISAANYAAMRTLLGLVAVATSGSAADLSTGTLPDARLSSAATAYGKQAIWIPANAMVSRTTNGAASGTAEMSSNKNMFSTLDYDTSTQEFAQFAWRMPASWNENTVTFAPVWSHPSTTTNFGVVFSLAGVACSNDDAGDVAFGTVQTSTDTGGTTNDIYEGPESSAITIAGSPAANDYVMFQVARVPSDGSDTMAVDARLHGIILYITTDAGHD